MLNLVNNTSRKLENRLMSGIIVTRLVCLRQFSNRSEVIFQFGHHTEARCMTMIFSRYSVTLSVDKGIDEFVDVIL